MLYKFVLLKMDADCFLTEAKALPVSLTKKKVPS